MKYYTFQELLDAKIEGTDSPLECPQIYTLFPNKAPADMISGEEMINTLLDSAIPYKQNVIWRNHRWLHQVTPESVGGIAYQRVLDFLNLVNCDMSTMYGCHDCENVSHAYVCAGVKNAQWVMVCKDCEGVLYSRGIRDKNYVILGEQVSKDEFEEEFGKLQETQSGIAVARMAVASLPAETERDAKIREFKTMVEMRMLRQQALATTAQEV